MFWVYSVISAPWSVNWICLVWRTKRPNTSGRWFNETSTSERKKRRDSGPYWTSTTNPLFFLLFTSFKFTHVSILHDERNNEDSNYRKSFCWRHIYISVVIKQSCGSSRLTCAGVLPRLFCMRLNRVSFLHQQFVSLAVHVSFTGMWLWKTLLLFQSITTQSHGRASAGENRKLTKSLCVPHKRLRLPSAPGADTLRQETGFYGFILSALPPTDFFKSIWTSFPVREVRTSNH